MNKPTEIQLIRIADAVLRDLDDRRGLREPLQGIKREDHEIYHEIQLAIGALAWGAVAKEMGIS